MIRHVEYVDQWPMWRRHAGIYWKSATRWKVVLRDDTTRREVTFTSLTSAQSHARSFVAQMPERRRAG